MALALARQLPSTGMLCATDSAKAVPAMALTILHRIHMTMSPEFWHNGATVPLCLLRALGEQPVPWARMPRALVVLQALLGHVGALVECMAPALRLVRRGRTPMGQDVGVLGILDVYIYMYM